MQKNPDKLCEFCAAPFHPYRSTLRFCSNSCSQKARYVEHSRDALCAFCGIPFVSRNKDNGKGRHWTKCCSRECAGKMAYKGGGAASRRRRRYGIEPEQYDAMAEQGCALCGVVPETYPLYVDHDHATKAVRGLLCARCNNFVAAFDGLSEDEVRKFWEYTHEGHALDVERVPDRPKETIGQTEMGICKPPHAVSINADERPLPRKMEPMPYTPAFFTVAQTPRWRREAFAGKKVD